MTLNYLPLDLELPCSEGHVLVLSVENPQHFTNMVFEMQRGGDGAEANWMLVNGSSELKISKCVDLIWNPLFLDLNEKKLVAALYKELGEQVNESLFSEYSAICSEQVAFLDKLTLSVPYPLTFDLDIDVSGLFKYYSLRFEDDAESQMERVMNYIRLAHQVKKTRCFVFLNLKQFFSWEDLHEFYMFVEYEKVHVLILEGYQSKPLPGEKNWIIDRDLCIIET